MKQGEDKSRSLGKNVLMSFTGESGDTVQFSEYIQSNVKLYEIKNDVPLSTLAAATFVRKEMATSLRSRVIAFFIFYQLLILSDLISFTLIQSHSLLLNPITSYSISFNLIQSHPNSFNLIHSYLI